CWQLWNLHQAGLDSVEQTEVGNDPRERLTDFVTRALDVKRCGGKVYAEINAVLATVSQLVDSVETFDPNGGFFGILFGGFFVVFERGFALFIEVITATIGMVSLIVEHQPMWAAATACAQLLAYAFEPGSIGFKVFNFDLAFVLTRLFGDLNGFASLFLLSRIPFDGVVRQLGEFVPVGNHRLAPAQLFHAQYGHQLAGAVERQIAQQWVKFFEACANGDVGSNVQYRIGDAF